MILTNVRSQDDVPAHARAQSSRRRPQSPRCHAHKPCMPARLAHSGIGEPGLPPLAPAIANAVANLTGKTPRTLPFEIA